MNPKDFKHLLDFFSIFFSCRNIFPLQDFIKPDKILISVDLPLPLGPKIPWIEFLLTLKEMLSNA